MNVAHNLLVEEMWQGNKKKEKIFVKKCFSDKIFEFIFASKTTLANLFWVS